MNKLSLSLEPDLVDDLIGHLEFQAGGGVPSPEYAATLLRRFKSAVVESQRGFAAPEPDQSLYQNAPPPGA